MLTLENNIQSLKLRIDNACKSANRDVNSVCLLPVSKTRDASILKQAQTLGFSTFGENYLSEAKEKIEALGTDHIDWHFIGPIQSNKTRYIAEHFDWVQTLDRLKIAKRLNDQRPETLKPLNILIQVNISDDPNKSGIKPSEVEALANELQSFSQLKLRGLMAIPQAKLTEDKLFAQFQHMQKLFSTLQQSHKNIDTLSMGMSQDLSLAIQAGSTMVRIGTDFFGERDPR